VREDDEGPERVAISSAGIASLHDLLRTLDEGALRGGAIAGTELPYVAPEVLTGRPAAPAADLFTIGALAFEMATGQPPFEANSLPELIGSMMADAVPPARSRRPDLPAAVSDCIGTCLRVDPEKRFASAPALLAAWTEAWK
jgi:serine/threonine-protein kinase